MKRILLKYAAIAIGLQMAWGCSPDDYTFHDNEIVDVSTIGKVVLAPNHHLVLADGHAQLDLRPRVYTKDGFEIPDQRVDEAWLEYEQPASDVSISRYFSTSNPQLIGMTFTTKVKIKGTDVESESVNFSVVAPLDKKYETEIRIPVVFHIIQTNADVESYGGVYTVDRMEQVLEKLNNVFGGIASRNPVGVNTYIRFVLAQYDPEGNKMLQPGVDRLTVRSIDISNQYADFLKNNHLVWPLEHYMNIWLISDREKALGIEAPLISANCMPRYVLSDAIDEIPGGLNLLPYSAGTEWSVAESGIVYRLQELDEITREAGNPGREGYNELIHYVGRYLGLMPTSVFIPTVLTDYCEDTHFYFLLDMAAGGLKNTGWYKEENGFYFRSENIMDDPSGVHNTVSKNQCERIRWVLENCPDRFAWKSDFAFTGK